MNVVRAKQTGGAATASLSITAPKAKNVLAAFVMQNSTLAAPSLTGWTFSATKAEQGSGANSLWFGTKEATGLEVAIAPTAGAGGAIAGISYFELEGSSQEIESIIPLSNGGAASTQASSALATSNSGDLVLACIGLGATNGGSGAWTGIGPMTSVEAGETRAMGGYFVPSSTLTAAAFTANWTSSRTHGMLVVVLKPPATSAKVVIGNATNTQSIAEAIGAGTVFGWKYAAKESALLEKIELWIGTGSGCSSVELGIYEDVAGEPGALLGHATFNRVPEKGTWIMASLSSTVAITGGTSYWLAFLPLGGSLVVNLSTTEGGTDRELNGSPHTKLEAGTWSTTHTLNLGFVGIGTASEEHFSGTAHISAGVAFSSTGAKRAIGTAQLGAGASTSASGAKRAAGNAQLASGVRTQAAGAKTASGTGSLRAGTQASASGAKNASGSAQLRAGARVAATGAKNTVGSVILRAGVRLVAFVARGLPKVQRPTIAHIASRSTSVAITTNVAKAVIVHRTASPVIVARTTQAEIEPHTASTEITYG